MAQEVEEKDLLQQSEIIAATYNLLPLVSQDKLYHLLASREIPSFLGNFSSQYSEKLGRAVDITIPKEDGTRRLTDTNNASRCLSYMNPMTPVRRLLLQHPVGSGKTRKSLLIAMSYNRPITVVVMHNDQKIPFENELNSREGPRSVFPEFKHTIEYVTCSIIGSAVKKADEYAINYYFSNKVVIMDEAHHIRGEGEDERNSNALFKTVVDISSEYPETPIVFLTATPVVDTEEEIYGVAKLLTMKDYNVLLSPDGSSIVETSTTPLLIAECLSGYVSSIGKQKLNRGYKYMQELDIPVTVEHVPCEMIAGSPQHIAYSQVEGNREAVHSLTKAVSRFATKPGSKAEEMEESIQDILNKAGLSNASVQEQQEHLANYSIKYYTLAKMMLENQPMVKFIFDDWKERGGAVRLVEFLTSSCWPFKEVTSLDSAKRVGERKILALHRFSRDAKTLQEILKILTSYENRYGDYIEIVVGTPRYAESLSIPTTRMIVLVEHPWNNSGMVQRAGRGIRRTTQDWLKKGTDDVPAKWRNKDGKVERRVDIKILELRKPGNVETVERLNAKRAEEKYERTYPIVKKMARHSIETLPLSSDGLCKFNILVSGPGKTNSFVRHTRDIISFRDMPLDVDYFLNVVNKTGDFIAAIVQITKQYGGGRYVVTVIKAIEQCWINRDKGNVLTKAESSMLDFCTKSVFRQIKDTMYHILYFVNTDTTEYQRLKTEKRCVLREYNREEKVWEDCYDMALIEDCYKWYTDVQASFEDSIKEKWREVGFYAVEFSMPPCIRLIEYKDDKDMVSRYNVNRQDKRRKPRGEKRSYYSKSIMVEIYMHYFLPHVKKFMKPGGLTKTQVARIHLTKDQLFAKILPKMKEEGLYTQLPI